MLNDQPTVMAHLAAEVINILVVSFDVLAFEVVQELFSLEVIA